MIVSKLKELDLPILTLIAGKLLENREKFIQFLKDNKWTEADMTRHRWAQARGGDHVFGNITDGLLKNTKGVCIDRFGRVDIGHWDQNGGVDGPYIYCDATEFYIEE